MVTVMKTHAPESRGNNTPKSSTKQGQKPSHSGHSVICDDADLEEMAAKWTPEIRRKMATKFENWALSLRATATVIDGNPMLYGVNLN